MILLVLIKLVCKKKGGVFRKPMSVSVTFFYSVKLKFEIIYIENWNYMMSNWNFKTIWCQIDTI